MFIIIYVIYVIGRKGTNIFWSEKIFFEIFFEEIINFRADGYKKEKKEEDANVSPTP